MEPYRPTISFWSRSQYEEHRATLCGNGRPTCTTVTAQAQGIGQTICRDVQVPGRVGAIGDYDGITVGLQFTLRLTAAELVARCPAPLAVLGRVAGCQKAAEPALEHRDPFRPPQRAAGGGDPLDPGRRRRVGRHREKSRKIGDQRAQRRHRRQLVVLARELRPTAQRWPVRNGSPAPRPSD